MSHKNFVINDSFQTMESRENLHLSVVRNRWRNKASKSLAWTAKIPLMKGQNFNCKLLSFKDLVLTKNIIFEHIAYFWRAKMFISKNNWGKVGTTLDRKMFVREKIKGTIIPNELISSAGFRKCSISKSTIIPMA